MNNATLEARIDALDRKMDLLLEYVDSQSRKADAIEDLIADASLIGKDVYDSTVDELDRQAVELEPDELKQLGMQFLRNIPAFITLMNTLESAMDFLKETGPIVNEIIIDASKTLGEFEQKGYFEFLKEAGRIVDNVVTGFTPDDVRALADNIVVILETVKRMTQPDMMKSLDNAVKIYSNIQTDNIPEYGLLKAARVMNSKEMKKSLGFMITFLQNLSQSTINQ